MGRRLPAVSAVATLLTGLTFAPAQVAFAAGPSTPDVAVFAQNPGPGLRITLSAHTDSQAQPWASLVLRADGIVVTGYTAHRVAAGDTSCPGDEGNGEDETGVSAVVRGVGVLSQGNPDYSLAAGQAVQVWVDLKDAGSALYGDQARVRIRPAPDESHAQLAAQEDSCSGSDMGGWNLNTGWTDVQQVQVHQR